MSASEKTPITLILVCSLMGDGVMNFQNCWPCFSLIELNLFCVCYFEFCLIRFKLDSIRCQKIQQMALERTGPVLPAQQSSSGKIQVQKFKI